LLELKWTGQWEDSNLELESYRMPPALDAVLSERRRIQNTPEEENRTPQLSRLQEKKNLQPFSFIGW
jgi:hypothetical protein